MTKHATYPVPEHILERIAVLEQKYGTTTAEFKALERITSDIEWTYDLHWWHCWMYDILPGNKCYHPDTPMKRELWALMEERGDELMHPPIVFKFKPEFEGLTNEEFKAKLAERHGVNFEPEVTAKRRKKRERKPHVEVSNAPPIPFID